IVRLAHVPLLSALACLFLFLLLLPPPRSTLFPYTTLFRSLLLRLDHRFGEALELDALADLLQRLGRARFRRIDEIVAARRLEQRSEEHTSELQSRENLVCRLLLEKKKTKKTIRRLHPLNIR